MTSIIDGSGVVQERYVYDPYGSVTIYSPTYSARASSLYAETYLFQGRPIDPITGDYDNRGRVYDPILGRPIQVDIKRFSAGDVNFYRWEGNDPANGLDPSGQTLYISARDGGRCPDDVFVERLWRGVKYEGVYLRGYESVPELEKGLAAYFRFDNAERPHQSLDCRTPAEVHGGRKAPGSR